MLNIILFACIYVVLTIVAVLSIARGIYKSTEFKEYSKVNTIIQFYVVLMFIFGKWILVG